MNLSTILLVGGGLYLLTMNRPTGVGVSTAPPSSLPPGGNTSTQSAPQGELSARQQVGLIGQGVQEAVGGVFQIIEVLV